MQSTSPAVNGIPAYHNQAFDGAPETLVLESKKESDRSGSKGWWQHLQAHPFFPSWKRLSHLLAALLGSLALWGVTVSVTGNAALPGGQLFSLLILCGAAHLAGSLIKLIGLPPLLGMLITGVILRNIGFVHLNEHYIYAASITRKMALSVILIRAGLGLDAGALRRLSLLVLRLAVIPSIVEAVTLTCITHLLLGLPWLWGILLGCVMAAVSPAVVIPCLFRLQGKGYGTDKGIPTLVIAAASLDDIIAVTAFGIMLSIIFSTGSLVTKIIQGPLAILIGIAFGTAWGIIARIIPQKTDPRVSELRTLMVGAGGLLAVLGSEAIGFDGAGPLGCIIVAFVACHAWQKQGWSAANNPVEKHFKMVWQVFQTLLFALIGTEINLMALEAHTVALGVACLLVALSCRILISIVIAFGGNLSWKEKIFVSFAWFPKATVQAALGPVAMDTVRTLGREDEFAYATHILTLSVMAILLTAPVGAGLITLLGPRLLKRTESQQDHSAVEENTQTVERPNATSG